jgi:hypothetical protein
MKMKYFTFAFPVLPAVFMNGQALAGDSFPTKTIELYVGFPPEELLKISTVP